MIRRLILSLRLRRARKQHDVYALAAYRANISSFIRWIDDEAIALTLRNLQCMVHENPGLPMGVVELRDRVRLHRAAELRAAHDSELRTALAHLRLLVREIDNVGESWADERRRRTLSGGVVTLGELRAAKRFIERIDSERIAAHEADRG